MTSIQIIYIHSLEVGMVLVSPSVVEGRLNPPPSKSYSHRAIAIAHISDRQSRLNGVSLAKDVLATLRAAEMMGASLQMKGAEGRADIVLDPPESPILPEDVIYCGGSGTTMRFYTAISTLAEDGYTILTGNESLRKRPMGPLIRAINSLGGWAVSSRLNGLPPVIVKGGGLTGGETTLPGNMSSQFFSALLIAGTMSEKGLKLKYEGKLVSKPYLEMTSYMLDTAGSSVKLGDTLEVEPIRPRGLNVSIPGDFGLAAPFMVMASITGGRLEVTGLDREMPQADGLIVDILRTFGVSVEWRGGSLIVEGRPTKPATLDLSDAPDLLPLAAVMAVFVKGRSEVRGVAHARLKESDRVTNMRVELEKAGVRVRELEDGLIIDGTGGIGKCGTLESHNDHRIFMALTALAAASREGCEIKGEEWVADSYPNFLKDAQTLGLVIS